MATPTHTFTRTQTPITPANPYLRCCACGARVEYFGSGTNPTNEPCGHHAYFEDVCPSWGPVDGCSCLEHLGYVPHPAPTPPLTDHGKDQGPL